MKDSEINGNHHRSNAIHVKQDNDNVEDIHKERKDDRINGCRNHRKTRNAVGNFELFRYADCVEILAMVTGSVAAVLAGCSIPVNTIIIGKVITIFVTDLKKANFSAGPMYGDMLRQDMKPMINYFLSLACATFVCAYATAFTWSWAGGRQVARIRKLFFRAVMRQDMGWFDTHEAGELNSRFSEDIQKISDGMCDNVAILLKWLATFVAANVVAFIEGWKLYLVVGSFSLLYISTSILTFRFTRSTVVQEFEAYAKAGSVAEQALRAISTVQAFQGQEKEGKRYDERLLGAEKAGIKKGLVIGLGMGLFWIIVYSSFAVAFWYGMILIQKEGLEPGKIYPVFIGFIIGSMSLSQAFQNLSSLSNARVAALKVFQTIDLQPVIDVSSKKGLKPSHLKGIIEFRNVHFSYPARPDIQVLNSLDLTLNPGQTVALVGSSGSGKSTTVQLLQRFYDVDRGEILVDGYDIKDLNVGWLREQLGVVSQEPVLFAASISENIRYGCPNVTQCEIEAAAKEANAHDFITVLPMKYDTLIGERGAQLSGGQKQRIAIARALVKNPRILLLDEATSALDHESEAIVQNALEKAGVGRTTIVIAHRLSTIRNADQIVAVSNGRNVEQGTHDELIAKDGLYTQLIKQQMRAESDSKAAAEIGESPTDGFNFLGGRNFQAMANVSVTSLQSCQPIEKMKVSDTTQEEVSPDISLWRVVRLNAPECVAIAIGTVCSAILGVVQSAYAIVLSEFMKVLEMRDAEEQLHSTIILGMVMIGTGVAIANLRLFQNYSFAKSGSALTARLRRMTFRSLLKQDMSFFDDPKNHVSALTTNLAIDAALVQGITGSSIGNTTEVTCTIISAIVIAFFYGWKLSLLVLAFMPILITAGIVQGRVAEGNTKSEKSKVREAGKVCSEAIDNIRTVSSLNCEGIFVDKLEKLIDSDARGNTTASHLFGIAFGVANSTVIFAYAGAFRLGYELVANGEMEFYEVFRVFAVLTFGALMAGRQSAASNFSAGKKAAARLLALIERKPKLDVDQEGGITLEDCKGGLDTQDVVFHYPTRLTVAVLNGLKLSVDPGQTLALVGSSGCGKSTIMQLLQRFYDPDSGTIYMDGHDLRILDLRWLRQQIGIVSQQPTLFDGSIASNIAYGDNSREVPMAEIIEAAQNANIHAFIDSLPLGYDTNAGDKGTQLSGGQKQRIAIARALLRRPKILLLDEATSALDTESEKVVQDALDKAREGRTCIVIAHRLTTIQNADKIAVIHKGRVQEIGSHQQLINKQGAYYRLLQAQHQHKNAETPVCLG